jgi:hypothetical protein
MKKILPTLLLSFLPHFLPAQLLLPAILSLRERATLQDRILEERLQTLLPGLMREAGISMWLLIGREYHEDPVLKTMLPTTWLSARRRTILVVHDQGPEKGLEFLAVARYNVGTQFKSAWEPEKEPDQWKRLVQLIGERKPQNIALNFSEGYAHADGITHSEYAQLMKPAQRILAKGGARRETGRPVARNAHPY